MMKNVKRGIVFVVLCALVVGLLPVNVAPKTAYAYEEEIPEGYTAIHNIAELHAIRNNPSGKYILMEDIDMTEATAPGGSNDCGSGWDSIEEFSGVLDGNGHRIIGMQIYGEPKLTNGYFYVGLFEILKGGVIRNLGLCDININIDVADSSKSLYAGSFAGRIKSNSTIERCWVTGKLSASTASYSCVGGLVGYMDSSGCCCIEDGYSKVDVFLETSYGGRNGINAGGIIGYNYNYSNGNGVYRVYSAGNISVKCGIDDYNAGALCGHCSSMYKLSNDFYLQGTSGQACGNIMDNADTVALTDAQMQDANYFTSFDFTDIWEVDPYCAYKYPQLKSARQIRATKLELLTLPQKTDYLQGAALELYGATARITYEDGNSASFNVTEDMLADYDMAKIGKQTILVQYAGQETSFDISINEIPVESISISDTQMTLQKGETAQLTAAVLPENATNQTVEWSSSNPNVVTYSDGLLIAKNYGTATIRVVSANGMSAECKVTVTAPCEVLELDKYKITLYKSETVTLAAIIYPEECEDGISWSSSMPTVASVSADGKVLARSAGKAIITAKADSGVCAECEVTVKQKLDSFHLEGVKDKIYTGSPITQDFQVTDGSVILQQNIDYTVTYANNTEAGTATIQIAGAGYYEGEITTSFRIIAAEENDTGEKTNTGDTEVGRDDAGKAKAMSLGKVNKLSLKKLKGGKLSVKYKKVGKAEGYIIRYATKVNMAGAKIVYSNKTSKMLKGLKKNKKYYVQVRAYCTDSSGSKVYGKWSGKKSVRVK